MAFLSLKLQGYLIEIWFSYLLFIQLLLPMFHKLNMTNLHKSLDFYFPDPSSCLCGLPVIYFSYRNMCFEELPLVLPATFFLPLQCIMIKLQFKNINNVGLWSFPLFQKWNHGTCYFWSLKTLLHINPGMAKYYQPRKKNLSSVSSTI